MATELVQLLRHACLDMSQARKMHSFTSNLWASWTDEAAGQVDFHFEILIIIVMGGYFCTPDTDETVWTAFV